MTRRAPAVAVLVAAIVLAGAPAHAWAPDRTAAERYIAKRAGEVSYTVITPGGRAFGYRRMRNVPAASVLKVMFMAAYLRLGSVRDRELNDADKALLNPMIRWSDNDAATRIADIVGAERMYKLARVAEMEHFLYTRPWGLSRVNAYEQARFMHRLERYIPKRHERYARYLLSHIVKAQRWGIGEVDRPNWTTFFKGGWGTGTGAVCHQVAFIQREDMRIAATVMITDSPSHGYATDTLKGVFARLLDDLPRPD